MADFVLGERRREVRWSGADVPDGFQVVLPGARSVEVVDASRLGACIRTQTPVRPGRVMTVRCRDRATVPERARSALVVRCWVYRIGRAGVVYEAGLTFDVTGTGR